MRCNREKSGRNIGHFYKSGITVLFVEECNDQTPKVKGENESW